jgi:hypothetical protein
VIDKARKTISKRKETKMNEFGDVVLFKGVNARIEDGINHISEIVTTLENDDLKRFSEKLRSLLNYVLKFDDWVDNRVRIQIENEAERQAKAMIAAGFSFNAVTVENVRFVINGAGEIQKYDPRQEDCDFPF